MLPLMKTKISVSMETELLELVKKLVKSGKFRNKSHLIEYSLSRFIKKNEKN